MKSALLLLALAVPALAAGDLGGHAQPKALIDEAPPVDERRATLEEMWQRGLLPPDQSAWAPADVELLERVRRVESDAMTYLKRRFGGYRPWVARTKTGGAGSRVRLTKEGYEKYWGLLTQDAIAYFESKGAEASWVFKLKSLDDKALFDPLGKLTEEGARVHRRAVLNLEVFWKGPAGQMFGTRRPPTKTP
ncbi:MAG: hypothetical protein HY079_07345 [Elusimicrobia bacterium]|nr:hypothetical protein [Elusimicrobiota bacterium]